MEWTKKLLICLSLFFASSCKIVKNSRGVDLYNQNNLTEKKICIIGDTGTGSSDQYLVASALEKENCDLLFHTGDIIYPKGIKKSSSKKLQTHFIQPFKNILKKTPMYLVMGNHDHKKKIKVWEDIADSYELLHYPSAFYSVYFDRTCVYFIDTMINYRKGQDKWIQQIMKKNDCDTRIAIGHHPYKSSGSHGNARGFIKKFLEEFIIDNVDIYISGHDHNVSIEKTGARALQLISGAGAMVRNVKKNKDTYEAFSDLGFATLKLKDKGYEIKLKTIDAYGELITRYEFKK